jgi:hypothetical protein
LDGAPIEQWGEAIGLSSVALDQGGNALIDIYAITPYCLDNPFENVKSRRITNASVLRAVFTIDLRRCLVILANPKIAL